jgi:2,3-diketo-5-methylthio-1-phosphopentane phosphatase
VTGRRLGVVCDFDGTATVLDIGDEISKRFGGVPQFQRQKEMFARGEIDTRGIIEGIYREVRASEQEICAFAVEAAQLRPGFVELVRAARDVNAPFFLASGGLRQYIEAVLDAHVPKDVRDVIHVRANEAIFANGGLSVAFPLLSASVQAGCSVCGSCKRVSVAEAKRLGAERIIGLGDGFADRCLVQFADCVWARKDSYLHRYCVENGVRHSAFTELFDAADAVRNGRC